MKSKISRVWRDYRVPLAYFIFLFNYNAYVMVFNNLLLQKACFPEGPPGTNVICNNSEALKGYNELSSTKTVARELLSGLVAMMAGPWRDHTGLTLPLMVSSLVGEAIASCAALVAALMWSYSSWAAVVIDSLCGLVGGRILFIVAVLSYATENSSEEQRAVRLTVMMAAGMAGGAVSLAAGGFLLSALDYSGFFTFFIVTYLLNLALCFHAIEDGQKKNPGVKFRPAMVLRRLKAVFVPRKNFFVAWAMLFGSFAVVGAMSAEMAVIQSFLQKVLYLNPEGSGLLLSFRQFTSLIISLIATPVLIKVLKMSEFSVAIFSTIPSALSCFGMAIVSTLLGAYAFSALDMMRITLASLLTTILSYCVSKNEVGVYMSFLLFGEAVAPLIINPLYVYIFNTTIDYFPGAFFILSGSLILITTILLIISSFKFEKVEEILGD